ncbi:bifunctional helix-turn-helix transcriptional regulator/GNAT family N-acetyltransferase [Aliikangiella maris]|uniref:Bifunctional helix-turn-helix transcriptional regulator/GNAT family N-acetyltransferase n=2 Tax=Aliikangiella maris TaxID=3162458 RepID=A0ABV3MMM5_9GAMM
MQSLEKMGYMALGSRFRRISELLYRQCDELYLSRGIPLQSRCFPLLQLLLPNEYQQNTQSLNELTENIGIESALSISELADALGLTHSAISQLSRKLEQQGWIQHTIDEADERRRLLFLSVKGLAVVKTLLPLWLWIEQAIIDIFKETRFGLLANIEQLEHALQEQSIKRRVANLERKKLQQEIQILAYDAQYDNAFYALNKAWLEKYFYLEEHDKEVLGCPQKYIIDAGGQIFFAQYQGDIIGTVALIPANGDQLELSKMAVDECYQGLGVGKILAKAAIDYYQQSTCQLLYLESNRKLVPAINLYHQLGFCEQPHPSAESIYQRADIYMVYQPK